MRISRRTIARTVASQLTSGVDQKVLVKQLAAYLIDNRRTKEANLIARDIETELASRGIVVATVWSPRSIDDEVRQAVQTLAKAEFDNVKNVEIREKIDPSLLAGIKLAVPGKQVDLSARHKLDKLSVVR